MSFVQMQTQIVDETNYQFTSIIFIFSLSKIIFFRIIYGSEKAVNWTADKKNNNILPFYLSKIVVMERRGRGEK